MVYKCAMPLPRLNNQCAVVPGQLFICVQLATSGNLCERETNLDGLKGHRNCAAGK